MMTSLSPLALESNLIQGINCGLSPYFHNKDNHAPAYRGSNQWAFGFSFAPSRVTLPELIDHILSGKAWAQGYFSGMTRNKKNFVSSQTLALDIDNKDAVHPVTMADLLADPFIQQYALLVHPSASSTPALPKTRVVFILSEPVEQAGQWEALQRALIAHFDSYKPDAGCKDAARLFYGSNNRHIDPYVSLDAVLPLTVAGALTVDQASADYSAFLATKHRLPARRVELSNANSLLEQIALKRMNKQLDRVAAAMGTSELHSTLVSAATILYAMAYAGNWPGVDESTVDRALASILGPKLKDKQRALEDAKRYGQSSPIYFELPTKSAGRTTKTPIQARVLPVDLPTFKANKTVNLRYISDVDGLLLLGYTGIVVKSGIDTGKTELALRVIERETQRKPDLRVLVITHRQALVANIAKRYGYMTYKDFQGDNRSLITAAPQMVITYDSLYRLSADTPYDIVVIDEVDQIHQHLDGDTMRGGQPARAYQRLVELAGAPGLLVVMDAHASEITCEWVEALKGRGNVLRLENTYQFDRGDLTLHGHFSTVYRRALALLEQHERGYIAIAANTRLEVQTAWRLLSAHVPDEQVVTIWGENSESPEIQDFIENINARLEDVRVLIYSPSLVSGIDIKTRALGMFGLFKNRPLAPADMLQMMGRVRNAGERHAWVQTASGTAETDWQAIYADIVRTADYTAAICDFAASGIAAMPVLHHEIEQLLSKYRAQRNRAMNNPVAYFAAYAQAEGYTLTFEDGTDKPLLGQWKAAKDVVKQQEKQMRLDAEPITFEQLETHRRAGTITPEIRAGHYRFVIEDYVGLPIDSALYDAHHTLQKRLKTGRFADMLTPNAALIKHDRQLAAEGALPSKQLHSAQHCAFMRLFCWQTFGCKFEQLPDGLQNMPAHELEARMEGFIQLHAAHLKRLFDWRPDAHSHNPIPLIRWILNRYGLKLDRKQVMRDGQRFMIYSLNMKCWQQRYKSARSRLTHLRHKQEQGDYYKPAYKTSIRNVVMPHNATKTPLQLPLNTHSSILRC